MTQQNNFQPSRKSRTGALVLSAILFISIITWRYLPAFYPPKENKAEKELQLAWEQLKKESDTAPAEYKQYKFRNKTYTAGSAATFHLAPFDPNTASEEELIRLGLPPRTAKTLIKYRSKGGKFRKPEDLKKLYTLSPSDYGRLAPYVVIAGTAQPSFDNRKEQSIVPQIVNLNVADADGLMSLRGIGPGYSKRILGFREALGGFIKVEQLQEVYGFPDSTYQQLKDKFVVDAKDIRKINVNTAGEQDLGKHPYIGKKLAANIIKLRNDLGAFREIEQLRQVPLINEEKYRKIAPYLSTH